MIIVDEALDGLEERRQPIRVAIVGAGFSGHGVARQIGHNARGMRLVGVSNRNPERARQALLFAGQDNFVDARSQLELDAAIEMGKAVATDDASFLARSPHVDVLVEATGSVEFGAAVCLEAFEHGKHVVLLNAELDATLGPILQVYAKKKNVILSACEGDEPGVQLNLYRWVKGMGFIPRVMGNVKGLQDPYRNPTTQKAYGERWGQGPVMVTSFADGSKISFEQAIVANATGFKAKTRGLSRGLEFRNDPEKLPEIYDIDELRRLGGIIDYVVGTPHAKVYCIAEHPDPKQQHYLNYYKMGDGPLYSFFVPYHLVYLEVPNAIARVALFRDSVNPANGGPVVEVCAVAKRDLKAGEVLDDYGMYMTYGEAVDTSEMSANRYLPEGLVQGCKLRRDIKKDSVIRYDDVDLPPGRLADELRGEQYRHFRGEHWLEKHLRSSSLVSM